jgi:hypothetical protein
VFDLDGLLHWCFVLGKYVDPFGFRRLDTLIRSRVGFHGREFRFRLEKVRGIEISNFGSTRRFCLDLDGTSS